LILITFLIKKKNEKVVLFKTPIMKSLLSHFTPRNAPEREALSHLLNPKWLGRGKVPFLGYSREQIQCRRGGACSSED
ncbi:hypothetical protein J0J37_22265, partial [Vibrio vulnificus]